MREAVWRSVNGVDESREPVLLRFQRELVVPRPRNTPFVEGDRLARQRRRELHQERCDRRRRGVALNAQDKQRRRAQAEREAAEERLNAERQQRDMRESFVDGTGRRRTAASAGLLPRLTASRGSSPAPLPADELLPPLPPSREREGGPGLPLLVHPAYGMEEGM